MLKYVTILFAFLLLSCSNKCKNQLVEDRIYTYHTNVELFFKKGEGKDEDKGIQPLILSEGVKSLILIEEITGIKLGVYLGDIYTYSDEDIEVDKKALKNWINKESCNFSLEQINELDRKYEEKHK
jgi:hypothetical protein